MNIKDFIKYIEADKNALKNLALDLHKNPELGMEEFNAVTKQIDILEKWNFKIENPFCKMPTAYKASYGESGRTFCFMSEYDALPGIGHACGHNLIAITSLAAGKILSELLKAKNLKGKVIIMGTPGEEGLGGKVQIVAKNGLKGIDKVIMAHPSNQTAIWQGCFGIKRYTIDYYGKASHAADAPELGKNALDAIIALFNGVSAWRQHLPEATRIHGIITNGGEAPNIIPEKASASFYLRAEHQDTLEEMQTRFEQIVKGSGLIANCEYKLTEEYPGYKSGIPDTKLNEEYFEAAAQLGMKPSRPKYPSRASTDFGDISHEIAGTHVYFDITKNRPYALHTQEFLEAAKSNYAIEQAFKTATALAYVGYKFFIEDF
jgi:amidohydrolase